MDMGCSRWSRKEEAETQKERQEATREGWVVRDGGGEGKGKRREAGKAGEADDT